MNIEEKLDMLYIICTYIENSLKRLNNFEKLKIKDTIIYNNEILHLKKLIKEQNRLLNLLNNMGYKYSSRDYIKRYNGIFCFRFSDIFKKYEPYLDSKNHITDGFVNNGFNKDTLNKLRYKLETAIDIRTLGYIETLGDNEESDFLLSSKYNFGNFNKDTEMALIKSNFNPSCDYSDLDIKGIDKFTKTQYCDLLLQDYITEESKNTDTKENKAVILSVLSLMSDETRKETIKIIGDYDFLKNKQKIIGG